MALGGAHFPSSCPHIWVARFHTIFSVQTRGGRKPMKNDNMNYIETFLNRVGIEYWIERHSKHPRIVLIHKGEKRFVTISGTPSDHRTRRNILRDVKRELRKIGWALSNARAEEVKLGKRRRRARSSGPASMKLPSPVCGAGALRAKRHQERVLDRLGEVRRRVAFVSFERLNETDDNDENIGQSRQTIP